MQHSLVINTFTDLVYIKYGVTTHVSILDRYHTNILKETDVEYACWLLKQYKHYMHLLIEEAFKLMSEGSVDNHQKITQLIDTVYFMYAQAYEHIITLTRKWIS